MARKIDTYKKAFKRYFRKAPTTPCEYPLIERDGNVILYILVEPYSLTCIYKGENLYTLTDTDFNSLTNAFFNKTELVRIMGQLG